MIHNGNSVDWNPICSENQMRDYKSARPKPKTLKPLLLHIHGTNFDILWIVQYMHTRSFIQF